MKKQTITHYLVAFMLAISVVACTEKKPITEAVNQEPSAVLYDAITTVMRGEALNKDGKWVKALAVSDSVITKHGKSSDPQLQEEVTKAMLQKADALRGLKHFEPSILVYDAVIKRVGEAGSATMQALAAGALINKAYVFNDMKNVDSEIKTYDELISRFANTQHAQVFDLMAVAQNNKGYAQILQAKQTWHDNDSRNALLNQALAAIEQAAKAQSTETKAMALGNTAYAKWLLGRTDEAKAPLKEALKLGGDWLYNGEIEDTKQYTVAEDAGFILLLEKVWKEVKPTSAAKKEPELKDQNKPSAKINI